MSELKWSGKEVIQFLNIFQNYPCLWDVSSKEYLDRNVKETVYNKLLENLKDAGMPGSLEAVKKKIKSLRDTYRKELCKIKKSKKSGAAASEVYKPKLIWFSSAEVFWHGAVSGRESSSNMDILQPSASHESSNSSDTEITSDQGASQIEPPATSGPTILSSATPSSTTKRPSAMEPPQRSEVIKKPPIKKPKPTRFENAVNKLHAIAELSHQDNEDQYDRFAQHIASQMRELPLKSFIILQSKFQNLISEERLASIQIREQRSQSFLSYNFEDTIHTDTSNNELEDVFSETSDSTCFDQEEPARGLDPLSRALVGICPVNTDSP